MIKPDKNYKMSSQLKMVLDMMQDQETKSIYKEMMIQAECEAAANRRRKLIKIEVDESE